MARRLQILTKGTGMFFKLYFALHEESIGKGSEEHKIYFKHTKFIKLDH